LIDCIGNSITTVYTEYLAKMLRMVRHEATLFPPGTVPVPVPVLSLVLNFEKK